MISPDNRIPRLVFFTLGFTAQLAQLVLIRELLVTFQGNEIAIAIVFGAWVFWTAIGCLLARRDRAGESALDQQAFLAQRARGNFALAAVVLSLFLPLEVFGIRMLRPLCGVIVGQYIPLPQLVLAALFLFAPVGLCLGAQFVYAAQAIRRPTRVYTGEAAGSAMAGFLLSLFLVPVLNTFGIAYFATSVSLLMAAWFLRPEDEPAPSEHHVFPHFRRRKKSILHSGLFAPLLTLAVLSAICLAYSRVPDAYSREQFWKAVCPAGRLVADEKSPFGDFAVLSQSGHYHIYQGGRLVSSLPDRGEAAPLTHFLLAQHPNPDRMLLVGGLSGMLKNVLRHPVAHVDDLEIDPQLVLLAQPFMGTEDYKAFGDARVAFHPADGRAFLRQSPGGYDLVIVNVGDPDTARINRFYTQEFFQEVMARLAPGGILCLGPLTTTPNRMIDPTRERNATIYWTLRQVFNHVLATPGPSFCLLASNNRQGPTLDAPTIRHRLEARGIPDADVSGFLDTPGALQINYELRTGRHDLPRANHRNTPDVELAANTDDRPAGYFLSMQLWAGIVGDRSMSWIMATFQGWRGLPILLLIGAATMLGLLAFGRWRTGSFAQPAVLLGIFSIGLSGMVASMMILLAYQNVIGSIYQAVGLLLALFMTGLAIGSALTQRLIRQATPVPPNSACLRLVLAQMLFAVFLALLPSLLRWPVALTATVLQHMVFGLSNLLAGLFVGSAYPLAIAAMAALRGSAGDGAALYAADLIGGCVGALLVSVFILPLFGFAFACYGCTVLITGAAFLTSLGRK